MLAKFMTHNLSQKNMHKPQVSLVGNSLVMAMTEAVAPVIWRMTLDDIGTASFGVQDNKKDKTFDLVMTGKNKASEVIASFESKQSAAAILTDIANALQQSQGQENFLSQPQTLSPETKKENMQKWRLAALATLVIIGLYIYLGTLMPVSLNDTSAPVSSTQSSSSDGNAAPSSGVPLSADEFLNGL